LMNFRDRLSLRYLQNTTPNIPSEDMDQSLRREISLARNIQTTLLNGEKPKLISGEVTGSSIPARLIGGDYYDFYPLANGKIRIVIGDVMGKGIPAAMLMILTRGAFRSAAESTAGPGETLIAMNNALYKDLRSLRSFVTVFCSDWDPQTGTLTYANAGHTLPLFIRGDKVKELPRVSGVMLGGLPNQVYQEANLQLKPDDYIYFYTDGIVEAQNTEGEQFKRERLINVLLQHQRKSVSEIEKMVIDAVNSFTEGTPQKDDITMVILKVGEQTTDIASFNSPVIQA
jgi:sigma-B regulation protein RsbU (phosphoserine phosphatase)